MRELICSMKGPLLLVPTFFYKIKENRAKSVVELIP